jgi:hypothetical protein
MAFFLFTVVNTEYGAGRIIYPDFASGFAATFDFSRTQGGILRPGSATRPFAENQGI